MIQKSSELMLKRVRKLTKYHIWKVSLICIGGDCWLGFSMVLHMPTTCNIAVSTRGVACRVFWLDMQRGIWSGHKPSIFGKKKVK